MTTLVAMPMTGNGLRGDLAAPGDKSISHRALMLGAMAVGATDVSGLLEGEDIRATAAALNALGVATERLGDGAWRVHGVGVGGLAEPDRVLDLGNAGTGARLLMGLVAGHPLTASLTGDASLCRRPMARVIAPLSRMGAVFQARAGGRMPLTVTGPELVMPIDYETPIASAQVKSAVLLAGLNAPGTTILREPAPSRDHTENLLRRFGAELSTATESGLHVVRLLGQPELTPQRLAAPGDPSSAAFLAVAGLITPGSDLHIRHVGLNPLRTGLFDLLRAMGGDVETEALGAEGGEPVGDLRVRAGALKGVTAPAAGAAAMIDEYPILCVAAALADGVTEMRGVGELRVKESDRIAAMASGLTAAGVEVETYEDGLSVQGLGGRPPKGGCVIDAGNDHRIAMSFLVLGLVAAAPIRVTGAETIATSYPAFVDDFRRLGARIERQ